MPSTAIDAVEPGGTSAGRPADWLELGMAALAVAVGTAAWAALVMAELGVFLGAAGALVALALGVALAAAVVRDVRRRAGVARPGAVALLGAAALALVGVVVLGRPHEYVLGGLDPGVYVNTAVHIARSGSLTWWDADVAGLSPAARAALFREPPGAFTEGSRLIGFYLGGIAQGRVLPHGVHLLPAAMAVGYALAGLRGLFLTPPIMALVGIGSVGLLARRWAGSGAGALAALLLLANPAENWFGRYPAAEMPVQLGVFGGALALAVALAARSSWLAFLAGALVGSVHLAKIDIIAVPPAVAGWLVWLWLSGRLRREHKLFGLGYGLLLVQSLAHAAIFAAQYTYTVYWRAFPPLGVVAAAVVGGLAALGALVWLSRRPDVVAAIERRAAPLWMVAAAAVVLLAVYGWYVRPLDPFGLLAKTAPEDQRFVRNTLQWFPRLGWFVPPLAILLGVVGYLVALRRVRGAAAALVLAVVGLEALLVLSDPKINPDFPWAARRWVGIVIPGGLLCGAALLGWLWPVGLGWRDAMRGRAELARALLPAGLGFAALVASAGLSRPLIGQREYAGSPALVESIAAGVDPRGVVLFDDDLVGWRLSAPIEFLGGRTSFVLFNHAADDDKLSAALAEWDGAGRPVYWLRIGEPAPFEHWGRAWQPRGRWTTGLREAASTTEVPPTETRPFDVSVTLYQAVGR